MWRTRGFTRVVVQPARRCRRLRDTLRAFDFVCTHVRKYMMIHSNLSAASECGALGARSRSRRDETQALSFLASERELPGCVPRPRRSAVTDDPSSDARPCGQQGQGCLVAASSAVVVCSTAAAAAVLGNRRSGCGSAGVAAPMAAHPRPNPKQVAQEARKLSSPRSRIGHVNDGGDCRSPGDT